MIVEEINAVQDRQRFPEGSIFFAEIITTGSQRMGTGRRVHDNRISAFFGPVPQFVESSAQGGPIPRKVSFGCKGHAATGAVDLGWNPKRKAGARSDLEKGF